MKLIVENTLDNVEYLVEDVKGIKKHYIHGKFMQAEKLNKNGRIYPFSLLLREVNRYNQSYVSQNRAFGELGHPDGPSINLDRVSHRIVELYPDGNDFIGKALILDTPYGNTVRGLLEGGSNLGVSCRGVGTLKPHNGYQLVQDDYFLATAADIVADPSAPGAFVQGIMEGHEWVLSNTGWKEIDHENAKKQLSNKRDREIKALSLLENFMSKL